MKIKIFPLLFTTLVFSGYETFAQTARLIENLKSKISCDERKLRFASSADPSSATVGFDDPRSFREFSN